MIDRLNEVITSDDLNFFSDDYLGAFKRNNFGSYLGQTQADNFFESLGNIHIRVLFNKKKPEEDFLGKNTIFTYLYQDMVPD